MTVRFSSPRVHDNPVRVGPLEVRFWESDGPPLPVARWLSLMAFRRSLVFKLTRDESLVLVVWAHRGRA